MKPNEIVIGSNVVFDTWICKVIGVDYLYAEVSHKGHNRMVDIEQLKPIPITKAMLLKNGFSRTELPCDTEWAEYEKEVNGYWLSFRLGVLDRRNWYLHVDNSDRDTVAGCDIQYVHQAQALMAIFGVELEFEFN